MNEEVYVVIPYKGKLKPWEIPKPKETILGQDAFVDTASFTFKPNYSIADLSSQLKSVLGYGVIKESQPRRRYKKAYLLGPTSVDGRRWGMIYLGGYTQKRTALIELYSEGCRAPSAGWSQRLHTWLKELPDIKLTRIDTAIDVAEKNYSVEQANTDWQAGKFKVHGHLPKRDRVNFDNPDEGRTIYFGSEKSDKYTRIYEKGKQLGDQQSQLIRIETQWRNRLHDLPLEMLIKPGNYLAGAYPIFTELLSDIDPIAVPSIHKQQPITLDQASEFIKTQFGDYLHLLRYVLKEPDKIVKGLARPAKTPDGLPKRLIRRKQPDTEEIKQFDLFEDD